MVPVYEGVGFLNRNLYTPAKLLQSFKILLCFCLRIHLLLDLIVFLDSNDLMISLEKSPDKVHQLFTVLNDFSAYLSFSISIYSLVHFEYNSFFTKR